MVNVTETLIYIRIKGHQAECWAPAGAVKVSEDIYRVSSIVGDETLEFAVGELVRCEQKCFPDGSEAIAAVAPAAAESWGGSRAAASLLARAQRRPDQAVALRRRRLRRPPLARRSAQQHAGGDVLPHRAGGRLGRARPRRHGEPPCLRRDGAPGRRL